MTTVSAHRWEFEAIGTSWRIDTADALDPGVRRAVTEVIDAFDRAWSRFRADSVVSALGRAGGAVPAPPDAAAMLDAYAVVAEATGGAVNPLVGDVLARRGYDPAYSFRDGGAAPADADWRSILRWSPDVLSVSPPATIDVGALGKGRLVDVVLDVVRPAAGDWAVVDGSGDTAVAGTTQRFGLEHPYDPTRAIGVWQIADAALCASATNRRVWGDGLHHVLDARTGEPVRQYVATWATARNAMTADAVATALFFDGGPRLAAHWDVSWVRMRTDGSVEWSPDCEAELFL